MIEQFDEYTFVPKRRIDAGQMIREGDVVAVASWSDMKLITSNITSKSPRRRSLSPGNPDKYLNIVPVSCFHGDNRSPAGTKEGYFGSYFLAYSFNDNLEDRDVQRIIDDFVRSDPVSSYPNPWEDES